MLLHYNLRLLFIYISHGRPNKILTCGSAIADPPNYFVDPVKNVTAANTEVKPRIFCNISNIQTPSK